MSHSQVSGIPIGLKQHHVIVKYFTMLDQL